MSEVPLHTSLNGVWVVDWRSGKSGRAANRRADLAEASILRVCPTFSLVKIYNLALECKQC